MEKRFEVRFTNQALEQIQEIYRYIAESLCAPDTASKWVKNLKEEIAKLSFMPKRISLTDEEPWHSKGVRRMTVKNHFVYFWIDEENGIVWIIAVIYARRDQKRQLENLSHGET